MFSQSENRPLIVTKVRTDSKIKSSAGIKIQTESVIVDLSLGVDNIGITSSMISGEYQSSFGIKVDLSQFKVGFEAAESAVLWDGDVQNVQTDYTNVSINGWFIAALFFAPALVESGAGTGVAVPA